MRKYTLVIFIISLIISNTFVSSNYAEAKSKRQTKKTEKVKTKNKKRYSTNHRKPYPPFQSLMILEKYFPEYKQIISESKVTQIQPISYSEAVDKNNIFYDNNLKAKLLININNWLGTPYKRGGHSKAGVDCSNFTSCIIEEIFGGNFPRSPKAQVKFFKPIDKIEDLQFGDFIFFSGTRKSSNRISHVGIYIGNGCFAHSSSSSRHWGVVFTHINSGNYMKRFRFGGRLNKSSWVKL